MSIRFLLLPLLLSLSACQIDKHAVRQVVEQATSSSSHPSYLDTVQAIKKALEQGTNSSVARLGKAHGFSSDPRVRIPLPHELSKVDSLLRKIGQEKYAEQFVLTLNDAAEKATPVAKDVFVQVIKNMSVSDAVGIVKGTNSAATDYFQSKSSTTLSKLFQPIVAEATNSVGVTKSYKKLTDTLAAVGYEANVIDLDAYVTRKTLDGLYLYISDEEKNIRANPAKARSNLVQRVFAFYKK